MIPFLGITISLFFLVLASKVEALALLVLFSVSSALTAMGAVAYAEFALGSMYGEITATLLFLGASSYALLFSFAQKRLTKEYIKKNEREVRSELNELLEMAKKLTR